mgnify:CR=1 FL=1
MIAIIAVCGIGIAAILGAIAGYYSGKWENESR